MKKGDLILLISAVVLAVLLIVGRSYFASSGLKASVSVNGEEIMSLPLDTDTVKTVTTEYGTNVIEVKDGTVSVTSADCPDKYCVKHIAIGGKGEAIICLPHKLTVTVEGEG